MNRLLWKEYRDQRLVLIAGMAILLFPHLFALCSYVVDQGLVWYGTRPDPNTDLAKGFMAASFASLMLSLLTLALLGGNAIAGERSYRSAEFLAILPISRGRIVRNKLALALGVVTVILGLNLLIVLAIGVVKIPMEDWRYLWDDMTTDGKFHQAMGTFAAIGLMFFCVGWFFSSFSPSPVFAIAGGLISPLIVMAGVACLAWLLGHDFNAAESADIIQSYHTKACLMLAPICFAAGTWQYLRRVEP